MRSVILASLVAGALVTAAPAQAGARIEVRDLIGTLRYRTFAFEHGTLAQRAATQERIETAIESELRAKGVLRVFGECELHVVTHVLVERHKLEELDGRDYFEYWTGVTSVDAYDVRGGTLVIDLVDTIQQRTVWRGVASMAVRGGLNDSLKSIDKIIRKLFKQFPEQ